ncbi:MAG: hypothetical protein PHP85_11595 [Gallionella sp.]|nr:hypothetical protein [Gallionella sp.]
MSYQTYFPATEAERIVWLGHFCDKLPTHGTALGFTGDEITATVADIVFYKWILQTWNPAIQQSSLEASAYKNAIATDTSATIRPLPTSVVFDNPPTPRPTGILPRLFNLVQRMKLSSGYSDSIGQDLGIIGGQNTSTHPFPEFTVVQDHGADRERVKISFTKFGHGAVSIDSRRNNGDWEHLSIALSKPWYDERPLLASNVPEVREYRLRWCDKNTPSGTYSPVQKLTVGP